MKKTAVSLLIAGFLCTSALLWAHCGNCPGDAPKDKQCCGSPGTEGCCHAQTAHSPDKHNHSQDADHEKPHECDPEKCQLAPDFSLTDQNGKTVALSDYKGKKVVVLEWANWDCPFVVPHYKNKTFAKLVKEYVHKDKESDTEKDVVWLTINSTYYAKSEAHKEWIKTYKIKHAVLADPTGKVGHLYKATNTPQMFVIDKTGHIVYQGAIDNAPRGNLPEDTEYVNYVDQALKEVLAGEEITVPKTKPYGCTVKYPPEEKTDA